MPEGGINSHGLSVTGCESWRTARMSQWLPRLIEKGISMLVFGVLATSGGCSPIDEVITKGSGYGFEIGQTKAEAYASGCKLLQAKKVVALTTRLNQESERERHPEAERSYGVWDVASVFHNWSDWNVYVHKGGKAVLRLQFRGARLWWVGAPDECQRVWTVRADGDEFIFSQGQSYDEVLSILQDLSQRSSFREMRLRTHWLARRQPVECTPSELQFVQPYDDWWYLVSDEHSFFDTVKLRFYQGRLVEIRRHRRYETP